MSNQQIMGASEPSTRGILPSSSLSKKGSLPSGQKITTIKTAIEKGDFTSIERNIKKKVEVGQDIMDKIETAVQKNLIGTDRNFRPGSYIEIRMHLADLAIDSKSDLQSQTTPIKRRGGSANEVFITPSYVIKAEGSQITKGSMIEMEKFSFDLAQFLGLEETVLPTVKIKLTKEQANSLHLTQELRSQVEKNGEIEVNLAKYTEFQSPATAINWNSDIIDLENFQLAGLFSGITQQTDHHQDNGGVYYDDVSEKIKFILFDNDICMQESNSLLKVQSEGKEEMVVPIRSFFIAFPCSDEPLSPRARDTIAKWDEQTIRKFCETKKNVLSDKQINALCERVFRVKQVVDSNEKCTLNQCYEAMYPFLNEYKDLFLKTNPDPIYTSTAKLDCAILACSPGGGACVSLSGLLETALKEDKISKENYTKLTEKIKKSISEGDFQDLTPQALETKAKIQKACEEVFSSISQSFNIPKENLSFMQNSKFLQLAYERAKGDVNEMKSLLFASAINYLENPVAIFEDDQLLWGSEINSMDIDALRKQGVTHILNVAGSQSSEFLKANKTFTYKSIDVEDISSATLPIEECLKFIDEAKRANGKVFIHCIEGKSRSGAITLAYFIKKYKISYEEALKKVSFQRQAIPNEGFVNQLRAFASSQ